MRKHERVHPFQRIVAMLRRTARVATRVLGAPDYEAYLQHCRERHAGIAPMNREQFERDMQNARYTRPGSRCC